MSVSVAFSPDLAVLKQAPLKMACKYRHKLFSESYAFYPAGLGEFCLFASQLRISLTAHDRSRCPNINYMTVFKVYCSSSELSKYKPILFQTHMLESCIQTLVSCGKSARKHNSVISIFKSMAAHTKTRRRLEGVDCLVLLRAEQG